MRGASPVMSFEIATPARIIFGEGKLRDAGTIAAALGSRALVVEGMSERAKPLHDLLRASGVTTASVRVPGEPTTTLVEEGAELGRRERCDLVVAMGGGSVIDASKAIAALITNRAPLREYLEVVGEGRPITERPVPVIAIPTTAGTGAEVTRNAVLMVEEEQVKVSLRSPLMLPAVALIDPELTYTVPPAITASTGMDALTQCIEPFVSPRANPITDALAREGMHRAAGALRGAYHDGGDTDARHDMAVTSLCGGLALANAKLGAVHGFAAPLCGMFPIPHGSACAALLAPVVEINVRALRAREPASPALARYDEVARILTGNRDARAEDAADWLRELARELNIPPLAAFGLTASNIPQVTGKARRASSMQGNPIALTDSELAQALGEGIEGPAIGSRATA
ncbi:MAG TPA: iron-containing alcohol dehydrogenase [Gemmatimonadaceae bacterium]|nr:iron-containing alcohol dehydrogenase [Gemmatimonadaceae bacterium]